MTWSDKYKKSIDCSNPKGFSQRAHCQARKLRQMGKPTKSKSMNEDGEGGMVGGSPVNNVGDGNIAGLGVGPQGEPGVSKKNKKKVIPFKTFTRNPPKLA
jgi:hypothetical protein